MLSTSANAAILIQSNFDAPPVIAPGVTVTLGPTGTLEVAQPGFGAWSGNYLANRSTGNPASVSSVLLTGIPAHTSISIQGLLGFLESWDSSDGAAWATPDLLQISVDGTPVLTGLTVNTASGSVVNFGGGTPLFTNVQANSNLYYSDTLVDMGSSPALALIPHTSSSLLLEIGAYGNGWQGGDDEAWGIDNLTITYQPRTNPVPGPLPLLGAASAFAVSRQLRRRLGLFSRTRH